MILNFRPQGDRGLLVEFKEEISPEIAQQVRALRQALEELAYPAIQELIPAYRSILIRFDPLQTNPKELEELVRTGSKVNNRRLIPAQVIEIPVCYSQEFGPDLESVALDAGLSQEKVIELHSRPEYLIYMLGFTPGFPYLGGLKPEIACPRLSEPRTQIAAGSVGIADQQTGIYPLASPGGWRIIGRTPLKLFDPNRSEPILLKAGDYLKFVPISLKQYENLQNQVEKQNYTPVFYDREGV
ncbi:MAG: 5-oxoprolinase subunit PxpB [Firmicutes bacterium]|jgi:KipI family sensor histidine kinase inhibitor|nr:5-oxoprolinase subunit PxpB [Bacillota bacterium]